MVLSDEHRLMLFYVVEPRGPEPTNIQPMSVGPNTDGLSIAVVSFDRYRAYYSGPPNDEALSGHPLASKGLRSYSAFLVESSPWIKVLEKMNQVHPSHTARLFSDLRHFVFTFHDSVFECIAAGFKVTIESGSLNTVFVVKQKSLFKES